MYVCTRSEASSLLASNIGRCTRTRIVMLRKGRSESSEYIQCHNSLIRILTDGVLCIHKRYDTREYTVDMFQRLWGEDAVRIRVFKGLRCLDPLKQEEVAGIGVDDTRK